MFRFVVTYTICFRALRETILVSYVILNGVIVIDVIENARLVDYILLCCSSVCITTIEVCYRKISQED